MDNIEKEVVAQSSNIVERVYNDTLSPTMKSFGVIANFLPGIIAGYLAKCQDWLINGKKSIDLTTKAVQEKVAKISEEKLSEPELNIAIPAIQQLSYCYDCEELRNMYANLLVTSMNIDTKSFAHPAFVDIIKQLTPDEAKLLGSLYSPNYKPYPLIDVNLKEKKGLILIIKNFSDLSYGICEYPDNIGAYLENLSRMGIIEISDTKWVTSENAYKLLKNHPFIQKISEEYKKQGDKIEFLHKMFSVTNFGRNFINVCVQKNDK